MGVDVGTTSVKAIAADEDGNVVGRARVPHDIHVPAPTCSTTTPTRRGARACGCARRGGQGPGGGGRRRGRHGSVSRRIRRRWNCAHAGSAVRETGAAARPTASPARRVTWASCRGFSAGARRGPDAAGYWNAQAAANHALCGESVMDFVAAMTTSPLYRGRLGCSLRTTWAWRRSGCPGSSQAQGRRRVTELGDTVLGSGTIDAYAEQYVAGADNDGDVLVILCHAHRGR